MTVKVSFTVPEEFRPSYERPYGQLFFSHVVRIEDISIYTSKKSKKWGFFGETIEPTTRQTFRLHLSDRTEIDIKHADLKKLEMYREELFN